MVLIDRLRQIMADEFDIHTDEELIEATDNLDVSIFGIFAPLEEVG